MVITLGDVLFGTDLSRLNAEGMRTAQKLAKVLQENPQRTVMVEGFTDSVGAASYNQALSERRAGAVQASLLELGVARERIAIRGYGESHPVAANDTAPNRQLNRRVEIVLSDDTGKITNR
jgi:outer membrane protein OmpA-like peptidoglycan-associated protein